MPRASKESGSNRVALSCEMEAGQEPSSVHSSRRGGARSRSSVPRLQNPPLSMLRVMSRSPFLDPTKARLLLFVEWHTVGHRVYCIVIQRRVRFVLANWMLCTRVRLPSPTHFALNLNSRINSPLWLMVRSHRLVAVALASLCCGSGGSWYRNAQFAQSYG